MREGRTLFALFALGVLVHAGWAIAQPFPHDFDGQYYLLVARRLAAGLGATTLSAWNLSYLPPALPMAADLHWMPVPSRVLVPGLWLWPAHGEKLVSVLLAACWGPLAYLLARRAQLQGAPWAALVAVSGGVWASAMSAPDVYALQGVLGGLALLCAASGRAWAVAALAALMALTRNDGPLVALMFALAIPGIRGFVPFAAACAASAVWGARNLAIGGEDWLAGRRAALGSDDYLALFDGAPRTPLGLVGHALAPLREAPALLEYLLTPGLLVLSIPALVAMWAHRRVGWVRAVAGMLFILPILEIALAPALARHGTLYRTGAALALGHAVLAADGLERAAALLNARRGYPPAFTRGLLLVGFWVIALGAGARRLGDARAPVDCGALAGLPAEARVFSSRPLEVELRCGRGAVMVTRTLTPARASEIAARYGARYALVEPAGRRDQGSLTEDEVAAVLPGWRSMGQGLWRAP